ncbi:TPX2 C-terminal [Arabidopsis thaliana x Arabidopsis arenosa]|uniref:TPX2 C-terminal n=2 Tax=Arabidopsis thaliana x Arabidopsis arenosa TaxID=1240361 RepID=A0A8T1Y936_9BRAS|nr:TPX2 C-terminal [Arabidopsis thaliana x Arabidopsis arenosa]
MCTGKSSYTKSSPKFGKTSPTSSVLSSGSNGKGMTKVEPLKERAHEKTKAAAAKNVTKAPPAKENKKPLEFKLHSGDRAVKRAMFNYSVATNYYIMKLQKKQEERLQKLIEEEEIRMLRKEMVPKAQLMPFFDRPFLPQRSSRPLTMPKEPSFGSVNSTCWTCVFNNQHYLYHINHAHA